MSATSTATTWQIDPSHSELSFRIRHLVGRVRGTFERWTGTVVADPASLAGGRATVAVEAASINTQNADRDAHLRTGDFFLAEQHPQLTFASRALSVQGDAITLEGDLTIRGITKPVTFTGSYLGHTVDPWGNERIGFEVTGKVNRKEFGVSWNQALDRGGVMLGDDVEISIALEAVKQ